MPAVWLSPHGNSKACVVVDETALACPNEVDKDYWSLVASRLVDCPNSQKFWYDLSCGDLGNEKLIQRFLLRVRRDDHDAAAANIIGTLVW